VVTVRLPIRGTSTVIDSRARTTADSPVTISDRRRKGDMQKAVV
jgi:hypothetical protein